MLALIYCEANMRCGGLGRILNSSAMTAHPTVDAMVISGCCCHEQRGLDVANGAVCASERWLLGAWCTPGRRSDRDVRQRFTAAQALRARSLGSTTRAEGQYGDTRQATAGKARISRRASF